MGGLTLDTGALVLLAELAGRRTPNHQATGLVKALARKDAVVTVPSVVVAEWWRGESGPAAHMLDGYDIEPFDEANAWKLGKLLALLRRADRELRERLLLVDAIVVASAASRGDVIYTSDVDDLERVRAVGNFDVKIFGL